MRFARRLLARRRRTVELSCAEVHDLVQSYLDGELAPGPVRDRLVAHLHHCERCGIEAEVLERIRASLAAPPPVDAVERLERFAARVPDLARGGGRGDQDGR
jgi:hypothetical protein